MEQYTIEDNYDNAGQLRLVEMLVTIAAQEGKSVPMSKR